MTPDRRALLVQAALAATASAWPRWPGAQLRFDATPFALGVASGCPTPTGVVLWTRLAGNGLQAASPQADGAIPVRWEVAHDAAFARIVQRGTAGASPALGHSVHVEVDGLQADRWYHYRFMAGDATSAVGRTRTTPDDSALPDRLRLVFASCQRWEHGHYAAWRHAAAESPDLVLFLGDYIYEYASPCLPVPGGVVPVRTHALRHAATLADYRDRYALHKSDAALQAAHAVCPWLVTWDDHEVENDYAADRGRDRDSGDGAATAAFVQRRSAAYQAFYENMPLRVSALVRGLAGIDPTGAQPLALNLYRRTRWGRLASFHVLDNRQYRSVQACRPDQGSGGPVGPRECTALRDASRTLLGPAQERWLDAGLRADAAAMDSRWSVIAQQTVFSPRNYRAGPEPLYGTDSWDGYPAARQRLVASLQRHQPRNAVLLGGDIHQNYVCDVKADDDRPDSPTVAAEFCGTSISSHSAVTQDRVDALAQRNPHVRFAQSERRGYGLVDATPGQWLCALRTIDDARRADSGVSTAARCSVQDGTAGVAVSRP